MLYEKKVKKKKKYKFLGLFTDPLNQNLLDGASILGFSKPSR